MNHRARLIGARLEIDSPKKAARGFRVICRSGTPITEEKKTRRHRPSFPAKITKALAALNLNFLHRTSRRAANRKIGELKGAEMTRRRAIDGVNWGQNSDYTSQHATNLNETRQIDQQESEMRSAGRKTDRNCR